VRRRTCGQRTADRPASGRDSVGVKLASASAAPISDARVSPNPATSGRCPKSASAQPSRYVRPDGCKRPASRAARARVESPRRYAGGDCEGSGIHATANVPAWDGGLVASGQGWSAERITSIPRRFRGECDRDLATCRSREGDGRLSVSSTGFSFYETVGRVRWVRVKGTRHIEVLADTEGEGETSTDRLQFQLSRDGKSMTVLFNGSGGDYVRCPTDRS